MWFILLHSWKRTPGKKQEKHDFILRKMLFFPAFFVGAPFLRKKPKMLGQGCPNSKDRWM